MRETDINPNFCSLIIAKNVWQQLAHSKTSILNSMQEGVYASDECMGS